MSNGVRRLEILAVGVAADHIAVVARNPFPEKAGRLQMLRFAGEFVDPGESDQLRDLCVCVDMGQPVFAAAQGLQDLAVINGLG